MWRKFATWRGPLFIGVTSAMILWLYFSGQLSLYIHPRYHLFTAVMSMIAVIAVLWGVGYASASPSRPRRASGDAEGLGHGHPHDHEHEHEEDYLPSGRWSMAALVGSSVLGLATILALVLLPPTTLGSVTVENRAINQSGLGDSALSLEAASQGDDASFAAFTVREWAGILRQTSDPAFFRGKPVDVIGFVAEDPQNSEVFYLTRFVVSCCSVDAQPVGIPISLPDWQSEWPAEAWVRVTGEFVVNPNLDESHPLVVRPENIEPTEQPREPYLF